MTDLRVAIVGSGPSGAYCAQELCEAEGFDVRIDFFERLPAPYGLVRYGVAPDHPKIKSIVTSFVEIFESPKVRFHGNVRVGSGADVTVEELRSAYDAVIVATGADVDRRLGIPGEDCRGVYSATDFVSWYSGHPDATKTTFDLSCDRAVVIGAGNVALDVARMLCRTPDELRRTDVPEHVVEALADSRIREVHVAARRGPAFAKYTNKELLELAAIEHTAIVVDPDDLDLDAAQQAAADSDPLCKRRMAILGDLASKDQADRPRSIHLRYNLVPTEFHRHDDGLAGATFATPAGAEFIESRAAFRSIGYRSAPFEGLPYDARSCTVPHDLGRVQDEGEAARGLYVVGWAKRGPSGVIGTNRKDAVETVAALLEDAASGAIGEPSPDAGVGDDETWIEGLSGVVDWQGWKAIDQGEVDHGASLGRGRVKLHDRGTMLRVAAEQKAPA